MMLLGSKAIGTVGVMAGVPCTLQNFNRSLVKMMLHSNSDALCSPTQFVHYDEAPFSDHGPARNHLCANFLGDWLLMLDTDHEFEPDLLIRILDRATKYNLDVVTGLYRFRSKPHTPVLYAKTASGIKPIAAWQGEGIFQVHAAGAGCLWIRRSVIEVIEATGFAPFDRLAGLSEDHSFFKRLDDLDIKAWCDPRIECNHLNIVPIIGIIGEVQYDEPFAVEGRVI